MTREPTTEELYEIMCDGSVIPLSEVKAYPDGHIFEQARCHVGPRDPDCTARLEIGNSDMMNELVMIREEDPLARRKTSEEFPFMLIPRRLPNVYNAAYRSPTNMAKRSYNPAFMHPSDLARLGLRSGDLVTIRSRNGAITGSSRRTPTCAPGWSRLPTASVAIPAIRPIRGVTAPTSIC